MRDGIQAPIAGSARMHAPFSQPGMSSRQQRANAASGLPSIQDFLDELPSIDDYLWTAGVDAADMRSIDEYLEDDSGSADEIVAQHVMAADFDNEGWAIADWQSFDWSGAAMLGSRAEESAGEPVAGGADADKTGAADETGRPRRITPSADEVARALDGIAHRIRSGELLIDQLTGAPPEAAMAAALAALLRMRG
jgi:hypothetical protein